MNTFNIIIKAFVFQELPLNHITFWERAAAGLFHVAISIYQSMQTLLGTPAYVMWKINTYWYMRKSSIKTMKIIFIKLHMKFWQTLWKLQYMRSSSKFFRIIWQLIIKTTSMEYVDAFKVSRVERNTSQ